MWQGFFELQMLFFWVLRVLVVLCRHSEGCGGINGIVAANDEVDVFCLSHVDGWVICSWQNHQLLVRV